MDGQQGIDLARSERPDLILMDMSLPVIDGWEATRRSRPMTPHAAIPVIGLTAHAMSGDREKAIEAGCDDYDTKPVELAACSARSSACLAPRQKRLCAKPLAGSELLPSGTAGFTLQLDLRDQTQPRCCQHLPLRPSLGVIRLTDGYGMSAG